MCAGDSMYIPKGQWTFLLGERERTDFTEEMAPEDQQESTGQNRWEVHSRERATWTKPWGLLVSWREHRPLLPIPCTLVFCTSSTLSTFGWSQSTSSSVQGHCHFALFSSHLRNHVALCYVSDLFLISVFTWLQIVHLALLTCILMRVRAVSLFPHLCFPD